MKILISESNAFPPEAAALLRQVAEVELKDMDRPQLLGSVQDTDVLWVRLRHQIDREVFAAAPKLRVLASPTTGSTHIDLDEMTRRGVKLVSLRGEQSFLRDIRATAEHTLALMLALVRHIPQAHQHVVAGGWDRDRFTGSELYGKTIGIAGYGRLGHIVARYLMALDATVLVHDREISIEDLGNGAEQVSLNELLERSDIVSVHINMTEANRNFFNRDRFARMKRGALFINTARGEVVDEAALLDALNSGQVGGAALDVLADERSTGMADHPLVQYAAEHANLILTPHIGGGTTESKAKTEVFLARKLSGLLKGLNAND